MFKDAQNFTKIHKNLHKPCQKSYIGGEFDGSFEKTNPMPASGRKHEIPNLQQGRLLGGVGYVKTNPILTAGTAEFAAKRIFVFLMIQ